MPDRPDLAALPPLLVPSPAHLSVTGGAVHAPIDPDVIGSLDPSAGLHPQGYTLNIAPSSHAGAAPVSLRYATPEGLLHGRATLRQLIRQYGPHLPCLTIRDQPAFRHRGVMLDVSRDKVPTMDSLRGFFDSFAALKLNHAQLYTEHTFAYAAHDEVWLDSSPVLPAQARDLAAYARNIGIALTPNQNCFGHLHKWLKLHRYAHLAETQGDWTFMHWPRSGPFSLYPAEPGSIALIQDLLTQLLPCFDAPCVNVGCDETFDIGQGRSRDAAASHPAGFEAGRASIYFDFVRRVAAIARSLGKRPMLWADIALSHPGRLDEFPADSIGLAWGYEPDSDFSRWCALLAEHHIESWVCPGTSSWRSITGRTRERVININTAAAAINSVQPPTGFLITDWGDMGHHQHWPIALNAIAHAAHAAWNPAAPLDSRAVSLHVFDDDSLSLASWLDTLGDIDAHIRAVAGGSSESEAAPIRNASALFRDLHRADPLPDPIPAPLPAWELAAANLDACERSVPGALDRDSLTGREIAHTLATARLAVEHAVATRTPGGLDARSHRYRAWLLDLARHVHAEHESLWPLRNRPGGLSRSSHHYQRIIDRLSPR
ncbi:MAG: family 20 glycosylhydrolase [Phycisphaerales bacterium]